MAASYDDCSWTSPDGLTLHFRDYPGPEGSAKTPVICLHGLTRNARDFSDLAEHIAQERRVIVPDMRGRGMSDYAPDSETYNPLTYVADVDKLLTEQGIDHFVSVGTSMGGLITMLLAQKDAQAGVERIAGLVLNDIGPEIEPAGLERISGYVGQGRSYPTWIHAARSLGEVHGEAFPDYDLEDWLDMAKRIMVVSQNGRISYDYDMAIAEPFAKPGNAAPADLWSAFEALGSVPTLLVIGELSDLISPATIARMKEINPQMTTVTVPRVGHAPTLDEPEAREAIDALLAGIE